MDAAVPDPAACREIGLLPLDALEMPPQPRLALAEEPVDRGLGVGPAAARRRRHRDDDAEGRIDRDPQVPRPGGAAERVRREGAGHRLRS